MPAYLPEFENEVFISYAHIDNRTSAWVASLQEAIRNKVSEFVGADIRVWRDEKLKGNDYFDDQLQRLVRASAVFVAVVSPRYVQSPSCLKECQAFVSGQRVRIAESSRIARIRKTPLPEGLKEPDELSPGQTLGFPFFEQKNDGILEFDNREDMESFNLFWETATKVAQSIAKVLEMLKNDPRPRATKRTVFLADVSKNLRPLRAELVRELVGRGHQVVPEDSLVVDDVFDAARANTEAASGSLAVHLFGDAYGAKPEGSEQSAPHLEFLVAQEQGLRQLVWVPPADSPAGPLDVRLAEVLDSVARDTTQSSRLEVCKTSFESFKEVVLDELVRDQMPSPTVTECKSIYLLCHDADSESGDLQALRKHLLDAGYPVNLPLFEAPPEELRLLEERSFVENDATVIFYGNAKDTWVDQKRKFLLSALGRYDRGARNRRAICLRPPTTTSKKLTFGPYAGGREMPESKGFSPLFVVGDFESFTVDKLQPLLDWLSK